jgi:propanediol dehydratase small subunit
MPVNNLNTIRLMLNNSADKTMNNTCNRISEKDTRVTHESIRAQTLSARDAGLGPLRK